MKPFLLLAAALATAPALFQPAPAPAQPDWPQARDVELRLAPTDIQPGLIRLKAGQPVRFRFINGTEGAYRVRAPGLFRAAAMRGRDRAAAQGITVGPNDVREVMIVPAAGRYTIASSSLVRRVLGMSTRVIVE